MRKQRGEGVVGRIEAETVWAAGVAALVMAFFEVVASLFSGQSALLPLRNAASIVLQEDAFGRDAPLIALVGALIHFSIAVMYGFAYGVFNTQVAWSRRVDAGRQALLGAAFGTAVWLIDMQFIARFFYPWMLTYSQFTQWAIHAFGFGLPLALLFVERELPLNQGPSRRRDWPRS